MSCPAALGDLSTDHANQLSAQISVDASALVSYLAKHADVWLLGGASEQLTTRVKSR